MIQNAILNMLGTVGVASALYQRSDAFKNKQQIKNLTKAQEKIDNADNPYGLGNLGTAEEQANIARQLHRLNPSEETAANVTHYEGMVADIKNDMESGVIRRAHILDAQGRALQSAKKAIKDGGKK